MRWVPDRTGRFAYRPYYIRDEIDNRCEARVRRFLSGRHGTVAFPLSTDDLTVLLEEEVDDLDMYADLSRFERDGQVVEGVTTFVAGGKPRVRIARYLAEEAWRETRLRTTLAHELGHVLLHGFAAHRAEQLALFGEGEASTAACGAEALLGLGQVDWMEWQAGYACGALLMPGMEVVATTRPLVEEVGRAIYVGDNNARRLIRWVREKFLVSEAAARVRLLQLGYLTETWTPRTTQEAPRHNHTPCGNDDNALICQLAMW